ncbi:MAG: hypothetical protein CSB55_08510 [Candidatus Cloacimonadota bacterium]|nr:MAG: hypothetical protein CSB55_08510 [Candidatus Cloacimonadota bacterium]
MKKFKTQDGSYTFFNEVVQEHYHSVTGAFEEALKKYVLPLEICDGMKILDFCFGLGYNSFTACSVARDLDITGLENDKEIISLISPELYPEDIGKITAEMLKNKMFDKFRRNSVKLIIGDAVCTIKELKKDYFDCVMFDPFSPGKAPELWSEDVFYDVFKTLKPGGKLATYSCAGKVRRAMKSAGFTVFDGPSVGRRSPSTIAVKPV